MTGDHPPHPEARRAYRVLGVVHAILFGAIAAKEPFLAGDYFIGAGLAIVFGGIGLAVFWYLANEHYRGNVPGSPGNLTDQGEGDD